jgi:flavin-dependent dehydrogenase
VPQPDGSLVVALNSDADLIDRDGFARSLGRTRHTAERARDAVLADEPRVVRADSGVRLPSGGAGWRAIGDAAMATDPLAGNGVARALRSALQAAAELERAPDLAPAFADYLDRRASFYLREPRWPSAPFWARRRPIAWREAPVTLSPEASLRAAGEPRAEDLWAGEALLPPRALKAMLASSSAPRPAHVVLSELRAHAPLGDRRLLIAVQLLVERGVMAVS